MSNVPYALPVQSIAYCGLTEAVLRKTINDVIRQVYEWMYKVNYTFV